MHNDDIPNNKPKSSEYKNLTTGIKKINKKDTQLISIQGAIIDTTLQRRAKITKNVAKSVDNNLAIIAPRTVKLPKETAKFNPAYSNDYSLSGKPFTQLNVVFDNDIFDNTDYYFTNGIYIELITPLAKQSPISNLLVGLRNSQINLFGFSLRQNIYTPTNPDIEEISQGDRPFSAFLTIGQTRHSYNIHKNFSIKSSLNFGVLGPASLGGVVQSSIHNIEPIGWTNQINNNIVIDYRIKLEKGIISTPHAELNVTAGGNMGTIFNKIYSGLYFRTGSFIPVYQGPTSFFNNTKSNGKIQYWFFVEGQTNLIFYDATLQGSMFNSKSPYVIQSENINRVVLNLSIGFALYYNKIGVKFQNYYLSPEFKNAYDFRWGQIKLSFQL